MPNDYQELFIQVRHDINEWQSTITLLKDEISSSITYFTFGSYKMFVSAYMTKTAGVINTVEWEGTATTNYTVYVYYR